MKVKELVIEDDDKLSKGVLKISLVDKPAIEEDFMKFHEEKLIFAVADSDKRVITGPAMIPDKYIYRIDKKTKEEFYVYFTAETIKLVAEKFFKELRNDQVNINHDKDITDTYIFESWIIENPSKDKSTELGYDLPKGTWMISMKVENEEVWSELIKEGEVNGFSIEGYFIEKFSKTEKMEKNYSPEDEEVIRKIKEILHQVV